MFEVVGPISQIELIASGSAIRERRRLDKFYGSGRWRKLKGIARVKLAPAKPYDDTIRTAEVHWYEAHGIGRKELKIKRLLD
jgi:hypothetical protein